MHGKILKILSNDLNGNVDDRKVSLFVAFIHKKYMNKYALFTFTDEFNKKKLYCASVHMKPNSIVTFAIREDEMTYINKFINDYLNDYIEESEYEIIDITNINKIELISSTPIDFDKLEDLDNKSIPKVETITEIASLKKPIFLYVLLIIFVLLLASVIYLHFNPNILTFKQKQLICTMESYEKKISLPYSSEATLIFNKNDELIKMTKIDTYVFNDEKTYNDYKNNNSESSDFNIKGSYKYDDNNLTLKLIYEDKTIIDKYDDLLKHMKKAGYDCIEGVYNE